MTAIYQPHPLALILPRPTEDEQDALTADIRSFGLKTPVTLFEGKLLDGLCRERSCVETKTPLRFETFHENGQSAMDFVLSQNLHRRHLSTSQRAAIAAEVIHRLQSQHQASRTRSKVNLARETCKSFGVAEALVLRAVAVHKHDNPEFKRIKAGHGTISRIYLAIRNQKDSPIRSRKDTFKGKIGVEDICRVIREMELGGWSFESWRHEGNWFCNFFGNGAKSAGSWTKLKGHRGHLEAFQFAVSEVSAKSFEDK